jgi:hypothetical protein
MPKFSATCLADLMTPERDAGRVARKVKYVVACEASDGSWCEFDADDSDHGKVLADNAVDKLGARGCSVWSVAQRNQYSQRAGGLESSIYGGSLYNIYACSEPNGEV